MPTPARLLLDMLTESLPDAGSVPEWATQTSQLMMDIQPGDRLVPTEAWCSVVLPRLPRLDPAQPLSLWVQAITFAWASPHLAIHGAVERVLLHWWIKVPAHDWPPGWGVCAMEMALARQWQTLAMHMCEHPHPGWPVPAFDAALGRRLKVDPVHYAQLQAIQPQRSSAAPWEKAGQCVEPGAVRALRGQDVTVPSHTADDLRPYWPEDGWPTNSVDQWPAMELALADVRADCPSAKRQHHQARQCLMVRALNLGQSGVARQLGWIEWLKSGRPLMWEAGPAEPRQSLLDGFGRNKQLSPQANLPSILDHVFQPALEAGRLDLWQGEEGVVTPGVNPPGLRFWNRALNDALAGRLAAVAGNRGPQWWRSLIQERPEMWSKCLWQSLAPTASERWWLWWRLTVEQAAGNPLHLAAVVSVGRPATSLMGEAFPWDQMTVTQETAWVAACVYQLNWLRPDQWDQSELRGALGTVINRWRAAPDRRALWLPYLWTWLGMLEVDAPALGSKASTVAARWWCHLERWVQRSPHLAHAMQATVHDDFWQTVPHPGVRARWRALIGKLDTPTRARIRSRA